MSNAVDRPEAKRRELLLAIRMNWLRWFAKPLLLLWQLVVQVAKAFWKILVTAGQGLRGVYGRRMLLRAGVGASAFFFSVFFFVYLAGVTGVFGLAPIGLVVGLLPIAWTYGETTAVARARTQQPKGKLDKSLIAKGNGVRVAATMALFVAVVAIALAVQALTSYLSAIPGVGPVFFGLLLVPDVLLSAIALVAMILFAFGLVVLPSHLLETQGEGDGNIFKRFLGLNGTLLKTLGKDNYWIQILIILPFASLFSFVIAVPMIALVSASMGITVGVVGFVTAFSRTTAATLQGLDVLLSGSFFAIQMLPLAVKIGLVLIVASVSLLVGFALSPVFAGVPSIMHKLYRERSEGKTWAFIVVLIVVVLFFIVILPALLFEFGGLFEMLVDLLMF